MKAIDTNILVRFLVGDSKKQAQVVYTLFKETESKSEELFVPLLVIIELIWVLESVYSVGRKELLDCIGDLLLMPILKFEHVEAIQKFIRVARNSTCDLSDLLIAHSTRNSGCETIYTFDKKASKHELFELLR
ncbi:MAG: VapC toxin family PIN domain ribonuclease [Desulfobulbus propionicus]|nr:MAG: VapC toxin family PIN domain ribonuclease [Desulfobulbus propionicus]